MPDLETPRPSRFKFDAESESLSLAVLGHSVWHWHDWHRDSAGEPESFRLALPRHWQWLLHTQPGCRLRLLLLVVRVPLALAVWHYKPSATGSEPEFRFAHPRKSNV